MGALDKRVYFSIAAFVSALLFLASAVLIYTNGTTLSDSSNDINVTIALIAGLFALIFSIPMFRKGNENSFVRQICGWLLFISGLLFIAAGVFEGSVVTLFAAAGIVAGLAIVLDMLALWVSRIYGAMYVSAVLAAVTLVMGIMILVNGYSAVYALAMLVAFAVWLAMSGWIAGFVDADTGVKTREVVEAAQAQKKEKPQAQNKKATPKAKKVEPSKKAEEKPAEEAAPAEEPKKVRTVELPKTPAAQAAIQKSQEAPKEESSEEKPAEKQEQKPPAKAMGDFMQKLMSSQAANQRTAPRKEAEPAAEPKVPATAVVEKEAPAEEVAETPAEEPVPEIKKVEVPPAPEESVIAAPVEPKAGGEEFQTKEPNWSVVTRDSSVPAGEPAKKAEKAAPAPKAEEKPAEEPAETPKEEPKAEPVVEVPPAPEEEPAEEPAETPKEEPKAEPVVEEVPEETAEPVEETAEPVVETPAAPAEAPAEEPAPAVEEDEALGEDIYTDNSPEALVRRAAWNKGLRCRRSYGDRNIPVAFVKGKVAVYVDEPGADTSGDDELRAEGWTVLRYNAADITDGKAQGEEIAAAVKENTRASKKKGKK